MEAPGQMKVVVVIASLTRGFAAPEADTPSVIRPYARPLQDRDEKGSLICTEIARTADLLEKVDAQLRRDAKARPANPFSSKPGPPAGLTVRGSKNQVRPHPLLRARVELEATLAGLVERLDLPELPEQENAKALPQGTMTRPKAV
jgi:hypothetical protein